MNRRSAGHPRRLLATLLVGASLAGCRIEPTPLRQTPTEDIEPNWIGRPPDDRFDVVADQLRGFDVAMWEVGYRYAELHWALQDDNWEYAQYQADRIRATLDLALQRRPARATSMDSIFFPALEPLTAALDQRDADGARAAFEQLTAACSRCHVAEGMPTVHIAPPQVRTGIIRFQAP